MKRALRGRERQRRGRDRSEKRTRAALPCMVAVMSEVTSVKAGGRRFLRDAGTGAAASGSFTCEEEEEEGELRTAGEDDSLKSRVTPLCLSLTCSCSQLFVPSSSSPPVPGRRGCR
eukprot:212735-Hanusia_phi.AAC.2